MLYITIKHSRKNNLDYLALCYEGITISFDIRTISLLAHMKRDELVEYIHTNGDFVIERR